MRSLQARTRSATPEQRAMAADHGLRIPTRTPFLVAGAMLNEQLAAVLGTEVRPASDGRLEYLADLANDAGMATPEAHTAVSVDAWIEHLLASKTLAALRVLRPAPDDVVFLEHSEGLPQNCEDEQALRLVSSIDQEGRVHLRGPGQRAWPNTLTMLHRAGKESAEAEAARETAQRNAAAGRRAAEATRSISSAKARLLAPWRVREREALPRDVDALRGVVETARDERPIQTHLERSPWLLGALLGGSHGRWVRPQVSLAGKFIADFFIADADSTGIRWWLIELESPRARQRIQDGDFSAQARHAVHQIEQWRSWLSENSEMARRSTGRHGLQLPDIEAGVPALILISRRHLIAEDESWKRRMLAGRGIQMHTYDWLLERVGGGAPIGRRLAPVDAGRRSSCVPAAHRSPAGKDFGEQIERKPGALNVKTPNDSRFQSLKHWYCFGACGTSSVQSVALSSWVRPM